MAEDFSFKTQPQKNSDQEIQNRSFDRDFSIAARLIAAYHSTSDTIKRLACDSVGRLKVVIDQSAGIDSSFLLHGTTSSVTDNTLTTILTYTNVGSTLWLDNIIAAGEFDGEIQIVINAGIKIRYCTSEQQRTADVRFTTPVKIDIGDIIDVKITHYNTSGTGDFSASIIGHRDS